MSSNYQFGELEDQLIDLLKHYPPDFLKAEQLISQGADLNKAPTKDIYENILHEILLGYLDTSYCRTTNKNNCKENSCYECEYFKSIQPHIGKSMVQIVEFFLEHGFLVSKNEYRYGAQCFDALAHSTSDEYMLDAARLLLDAGAIDTIAYDDETALGIIATTISFLVTCEHDHHLGNIFEAYYQMVLAATEGKPYRGISHYEKCIGKQLKRVFATKPAEGNVFYDLDLAESKHKNCFNQTLYFEYDSGYLIITQHTQLWTDTILPDVEMIDVSENFLGIVGGTIKQITFEHREFRKGNTCYGQPITNLEMNDGIVAKFSINFGEVETENRAAYYNIDR